MLKEWRQGPWLWGITHADNDNVLQEKDSSDTYRAQNFWWKEWEVSMKGRDYDLTFKRWVGICYVDMVIGDSVVKGTASEKNQVCIFNIYLFATLGLSAACGIWFPDQGSIPGPLCRERGVSVTGPSGKCLTFCS